MNIQRIQAVFIAWPFVMAVLTRILGPRRAVLVGVIGGHLFMPAGDVTFDVAGLAIPFDRWKAISLGLIAGPLMFDVRALFKVRLSWFDLPIALYYLCPLIGLATGEPGSTVDVVDMMVGRGPVWVVPYVLGRAHFSGGDGPARIAEALVFFGLVYIPVCVYEEIVGPDNYLAFSIFGIPYGEGMVHRLGGWRPEGFLRDGIAVAAWMALTTVTATWLWLGGWKPGRWPAWAAALALLLAAISCRGIYGYILLALGLPAVLLTKWLRTRVFLIALAVMPLLYMTVRATGVWDASILVNSAKLTGREGSLQWRLEAEDEIVQRVSAYNLAFGMGGSVGKATLSRPTDGRWLQIFWMGGLVGLSLQVLTFHILPAALAIRRPSGRPDDRQAAAPSWALACWCILQLFDSLHNGSYFVPTGLVAGCLVGFSTWRGPEAFPEGRGPKAGRTDPRPIPFPLIATVIVLVAIEILGRWKTAPPPPPSPANRIEKRDAPP
jgi:hypothetical protein